MNNRKRKEDEKYQINILQDLFGHITYLPSIGKAKKYLIGGKIYTQKQLKKECYNLQNLEHINVIDKIQDLDCYSEDNGWHFPITLKYQKIDGGAQNLAVENIIQIMKQAVKIDSIDKTCLIVYIGGSFYTKLRQDFRNASLFNIFNKKFNIYDYLSIIQKELNIKCKILCDNNLHKNKTSLYNYCIEGIYENVN